MTHEDGLYHPLRQAPGDEHVVCIAFWLCFFFLSIFIHRFKKGDDVLVKHPGYFNRFSATRTRLTVLPREIVRFEQLDTADFVAIKNVL